MRVARRRGRSNNLGTEMSSSLKAERFLYFGGRLTFFAAGFCARLDHGEMREHVAEVFLQAHHFAALAGNLCVKGFQSGSSHTPGGGAEYDAR